MSSMLGIRVPTGHLRVGFTQSIQRCTFRPIATPKIVVPNSSAWSIPTPIPEPYPSPTDVAQAPDPAWHYVIVSFRLGQPMVRSYRILEGEIAEEPVLVLEQ